MPPATRLSEDDFAEFVRTHQAHVWRYLRYLGCDTATADDLTQEAFLAIYHRGISVRSTGQSRSYLRRTARNLFLKDRRGADRFRAFEDLDSADAAWERLVPRDDSDAFRRSLDACLEQLTERARDGLMAVYGTRCSRKQAATQLGLTDQGMKTLLRRSLATLTACIKRRLLR